MNNSDNRWHVPWGPITFKYNINNTRWIVSVSWWWLSAIANYNQLYSTIINYNQRQSNIFNYKNLLNKYIINYNCNRFIFIIIIIIIIIIVIVIVIVIIIIIIIIIVAKPWTPEAWPSTRLQLGCAESGDKNATRRACAGRGRWTCDDWCEPIAIWLFNSLPWKITIFNR